MAFRSDYGGQADSDLRRLFGRQSPFTYNFSLFTVSPGSCHKSAIVGQSNGQSWSFLFIGILEGLKRQADSPRT